MNSEDRAPSSLEMIEYMVDRPAMYWGDSDNHFHSFIAFLAGYQFGLQKKPNAAGCRQQLVPDDFHRFVTEHYGFEYPYGGYGWMTFIEERADSDHEALQLFLELRRLYEPDPDNAQQDGETDS